MKDQPSAERERRLLRVLVPALLTAATAVLIATHPWQEDRPHRFVVVSAVLLVTLGIHLLVVSQLTARDARSASAVLAASVGAAAAGTVVWVVPQLSGPRPVDGAWSATVTVELCALAAAGFASVRTRATGPAVVAALWAGALSSYALFAGALLVAEDRVAALDDYLSLLSLSCVLSVLLCLTVALDRRPALATLIGASRTRGSRGPAGRGSASGARRR